MASSQSSADEWIRRQLKHHAPRSRSLIITMFGDSVAPYSDGVWLSDLIGLLEPLGANERVVRTSVFRLTEQGWLVSKRDGRRSYYTLASGGRRKFQHAYERVYNPPQPWNGVWTIVILPKNDNSASERAELRRELEWEGYAFLAPGIFIRPTQDSAVVEEILQELQLKERAVVMQTQHVAPATGAPVATLVSQCWNLREINSSYVEFNGRFQPLLTFLNRGGSLTPEQAFVAQTLLIDAFRRVSLHDPRLPDTLLPPHWPGHAAYQLCRDLYRRTFGLARGHLAPRFGPSGGRAHRPPTEVLRRFGGLE